MCGAVEWPEEGLCASVQGSEEALYVYMATPLGPALAQITEQHLLKGRAVGNQPNACPPPAALCHDGFR